MLAEADDDVDVVEGGLVVVGELVELSCQKIEGFLFGKEADGQQLGKQTQVNPQLALVLNLVHEWSVGQLQ